MRSDEEKELASALTKLWFNQVVSEFPNWSLYKIERYFEPLYPSKPHEPLTPHRSKWNKYRKGQHRPGIRTIQKIALHKPDTKAILSSRLEKILFSKQSRWQILSEQDIKFIVLDIPKYKLNYSASFQDLASLIRMWNYTLINYKKACKSDLYKLSLKIYRTLLLLSLDFDLDENKENFIYLYKTFVSKIFSKSNNERTIFSEKRFINQARILKKITDIHLMNRKNEQFSLHGLAYWYMTSSSSFCKYPNLFFSPYKSPIFYEINCIFREIHAQGFYTKDNLQRICWLNIFAH